MTAESAKNNNRVIFRNKSLEYSTWGKKSELCTESCSQQPSKEIPPAVLTATQGWAPTAYSQGKQRGVLPTHACRVSRFLLVPLNRPPAASLLNQEAKEFLASLQSPGSSAASPGWVQWGLVPTLLAAVLPVTAYLRHPPGDCPFWTSVLSTEGAGQNSQECWKCGAS